MLEENDFKFGIPKFTISFSPQRSGIWNQGPLGVHFTKSVHPKWEFQSLKILVQLPNTCIFENFSPLHNIWYIKCYSGDDLNVTK